MKRFISAIISLILILGLVAVSRAENAGEVLEVINCNEWVSLRREPDEGSERLRKVPLGAMVLCVGSAPEGWAYVQYDGREGYVHSGYLTLVSEGGADHPDGSEELSGGFDDLPGLPPYDAFMAIGEPVCEGTYNGFHVIARRAYDFSEDKEELLAVCYDAANSPLWTAFEVSYTLTELVATHAFIGGTAEAPCLVTFDSGKGFTARAIDERGSLLWISNCATGVTALETVLPGGGLKTEVGGDGTIYAVSYYGEAPVAIDVNGNFLWKAQNPDPLNIYWPFEIRPSAEAVTVLYDSCMEAENMVYAVTYDPNSGACTGCTTIENPNLYES